MKVAELPQKIWTSKPVTSIKNFTKKLYLPGFEGLNLYEVALFFWEGWKNGAVATRASSVSFTVFLALLPTLLLLMSIIPYIPIENFQQELLDGFQRVMPRSMNNLIGDAFEEMVSRKHSAILSIGFALSLYYASNSINAILTSFNSSYHLTIRRNPLKQRLLAVLLIVILTSLTVIAIGLLVFSDTFFYYLFDQHFDEYGFLWFVLSAAKWASVIIIFMFAISVMYNIGDTQRSRWRFISAGSTFTTFFGILISWGFAYYVTNFGSYNKLYGSLGTIIVLLMWIYFNIMILILGFELNAAIANAKRQKMIRAEQDAKIDEIDKDDSEDLVLAEDL